MRDITIKAQTIGTSVAGEALTIGAIANKQDSVANKEVIERLLCLLTEQGRSMAERNSGITSIDAKKLASCVEELAQALRSENSDEKKRNRIEAALEQISGLMGGTAELFQNFSKIANLFGVDLFSSDSK